MFVQYVFSMCFTLSLSLLLPISWADFYASLLNHALAYLSPCPSVSSFASKSCPWMRSIYVNMLELHIFNSVRFSKRLRNSHVFLRKQPLHYMDHWIGPHQKCWLDLINIGGVQRERLRYMRGVRMNHPDSAWAIYTFCRTSSSSGSFRILPMCRLAVPSKHSRRHRIPPGTDIFSGMFS